MKTNARARLTSGYWTKLCQDILAEHNCFVSHVDLKRAGHVRVTLKHRVTRATRFMQASASPSDNRANKQARTVCRRVCRELQGVS